MFLCVFLLPLTLVTRPRRPRRESFSFGAKRRFGANESVGCAIVLFLGESDGAVLESTLWVRKSAFWC